LAEPAISLPSTYWESRLEAGLPNAERFVAAHLLRPAAAKIARETTAIRS
jgi:hypothetical protein